ncbi:hypothetical protein AUJ46_04780 [Candidatus Peregrinibacteria bacterium CG1_02_54_53]|nr:MAG: hypothetical protein AUJ46_04780 [Candidatus Peregrinibacteria bacterium CG1_02_54_53]
MSTVENFPDLTTGHEVVTPDTWPEGVPRDGIELRQMLDAVQSGNYDQRLQLMAKQSSRFEQIKALEGQLSPLTYSSRPFTDLQMARHLAEDLQKLRDLYENGNFVGRTIRGVTRGVRSWLEKQPAEDTNG